MEFEYIELFRFRHPNHQSVFKSGKSIPEIRNWSARGNGFWSKGKKNGLFGK